VVNKSIASVCVYCTFSQRQLEIDRETNLNAGVQIGSSGDYITDITYDTDTVIFDFEGTLFQLVDYSEGNSFPSGTQGDVLYYNGSNWVVLAAGTSGYVLSTNGAGANPTWVEQTGGGGGGEVSFSDTNTTIGTIYNESVLEARLEDTTSFDTSSASDYLVFISDSVGESALYWNPLQITQAIGEGGGGTSYDSVYIYAELYRIRDSINEEMVILDSRITQNENDIVTLYALVEGLGGEVPPRYDSSQVPALDGTVLYVFLSKPADYDSVPNVADFAFTEDGGSMPITSVAFSDGADSLIFAMDTTFSAGTTILSSYTPSAYPRLQDSSENVNTGWADKPVVNNVLASQFSAEYAAYYNELTVKPSETIAQHQDTLFRDIVAYGFYDTIKGGYILAQESNANGEALVDIINPSTVSAVSTNNPTFTSNRGIAHNGSTSYTDLMFNAADYPYLLDAISIGLYSRTAASNNNASIGASDGSYTTFFTPQHTDNSTYYGINSGGFAAEVNGTGGDGFFVFNRTSSGNVTAYLDGTIYSNQSQASSGLPNVNYWIGGYNNNGALGEPSNGETSLVLFMGLLNATQIANLNTAVEKFMDAIGAGVQ